MASSTRCEASAQGSTPLDFYTAGGPPARDAGAELTRSAAVPAPHLEPLDLRGRRDPHKAIRKSNLYRVGRCSAAKRRRCRAYARADDDELHCPSIASRSGSGFARAPGCRPAGLRTQSSSRSRGDRVRAAILPAQGFVPTRSPGTARSATPRSSFSKRRTSGPGRRGRRRVDFPSTARAPTEARGMLADRATGTARAALAAEFIAGRDRPLRASRALAHACSTRSGSPRGFGLGASSAARSARSIPAPPQPPRAGFGAALEAVRTARYLARIARAACARRAAAPRAAASASGFPRAELGRPRAL